MSMRVPSSTRPITPPITTPVTPSKGMRPLTPVTDKAALVSRDSLHFPAAPKGSIRDHRVALPESREATGATSNDDQVDQVSSLGERYYEEADEEGRYNSEPSIVDVFNAALGLVAIGSRKVAALTVRVAQPVIALAGEALAKVKDRATSAIMDRITGLAEEAREGLTAIMEDVVDHMVIPKVEPALVTKLKQTGPDTVFRGIPNISAMIASKCDAGIAKKMKGANFLEKQLLKSSLPDKVRDKVIDGTKVRLKALLSPESINKMGIAGLDTFLSLVIGFQHAEAKGINTDSPKFALMVIKSLTGQDLTIEKFEKMCQENIVKNTDKMLKNTGVGFLVRAVISQEMRTLLPEELAECRMKMAANVPPGTVSISEAVEKAFLVSNKELALFNAFMENNKDIVGLFIMDKITASMAQPNSGPKPVGMKPGGMKSGEDLNTQYKAKIEDLNRRGFLPPLMARVLVSQEPSKLLDGVVEPWRKWCSE